MEPDYKFTRHARQRSAERSIPPFVAEAIIAYGHSREAGDGARKYSLAKESMRELRQDAGSAFTNTINFYRRRNAYVVAVGGRIVTVAFASRPLSY
jgi:hypothetical protein